MDKLFFQSWEGLLRIAIISVLAFISLVIILRITGKRTLTKMNAFDFIVTIALGSSFATVALSKTVPLIEGVLVFVVLIFMQLIITWLSVRVRSFKKLITSQPTLLVYKGDILHDALKKERITVEELHVAVRKKDIVKLDEIDAVIMESNGDLTVISKLNSLHAEVVNDVEKKFLDTKKR